MQDTSADLGQHRNPGGVQAACRAMLLALLDTGCRASEFVALDVQDVNMATGAVIIRSGKGGKFRTAFMGASTRRDVRRRLRHGTGDAGPFERLL